MNFLMSIWNFFSGKKTVIGAIVLFVAMILTQVVVGVWHFSPSWMQSVVDTLNWIGGVTVPMGIGHKAVKNSAV